MRDNLRVCMFKQEVMRTLNYIMVIEMQVSQWIRDILDGAILGLGSCYKDQLGREESGVFHLQMTKS